MALKLKIYISGLCVLVPIKQDGRLEEVMVLFPRLEEENQFGIPAHRTMIQFNPNLRVSNIPSFPLFEDRQGNQQTLWLLDSEELEIVSPNSDMGPELKLDLWESVEDGEYFPQNQGEDFLWCLPIRNELGQIQEARDELLGENVGEDAARRIAARFRIRRGKVKPVGFNVEAATGDFYMYQTGEVVQATALGILLEVEVPQHRVYFKATPYHELGRHPEDRENPPRVLALEVPKRGGSGDGETNPKEIEIFLMCRRWDHFRHQCFPMERGQIENWRERELGALASLTVKSGWATPKYARRAQTAFLENSQQIENEPMRLFFYSREYGEGGRPNGPCEPASAKAGA